MTKIIIVAGGLATRMQPLTKGEIPKCMININGKPLIQYQLEFFKKAGYIDIIFCVSHLAEKVKEYFKDGKSFGLNIQYVKDEEMGTAGSVKLAEKLIDNDFIVYYGDNLTNMDFNKFLEFHRKKGGMATIVIRPKKYDSSLITIDDDNRIKTFFEKPSVYVNSGIYAFKKEIFKLIPKNQKYDFARQLFPLIIFRIKKIKLYGYMTAEFFREIGRVEKYENFLKEVKNESNFFG